MRWEGNLGNWLVLNQLRIFTLVIFLTLLLSPSFCFSDWLFGRKKGEECCSSCTSPRTFCHCHLTIIWFSIMVPYKNSDAMHGLHRNQAAISSPYLTLHYIATFRCEWTESMLGMFIKATGNIWIKPSCVNTMDVVLKILSVKLT